VPAATDGRSLFDSMSVENATRVRERVRGEIAGRENHKPSPGDVLTYVSIW
jgi:hypothetical protein